MMNNFITWKPSDNSEPKKKTSRTGNTAGLRRKTSPLSSLLIPLFSLFFILSSLFISCDEPYGKLGGSDITGTYQDNEGIAGIIGPWRGVWYSHYGKRRLDGYTVGKWENIKTDLGYKLELFPGFDPDAPRLRDDYEIQPEDYYIFYDDTVYGQGEDGSGSGNGGWGFDYMGIVRAVNIFNDNPETGAVIIEYFDGAYPEWLSREVPDKSKPFFGIFYRVINPDCVQMANAVDLAALFDGREYHTETATLQEAIAKNTAINDAEFISWGVVIPQDRE